jgi:cytochrome c-type biogenesis protein CcmH/NrfF
VSRSLSPQALQARDEVAALILAGKSDQEILHGFVARYGTRVLMEPAGNRARWLYALPVLALMVGVLVVIRFLRARLQTPVAAKDSPPVFDDSDWNW